jgi:hypothetical protein
MEKAKEIIKEYSRVLKQQEKQLEHKHTTHETTVIK